jgi:hypothetical protein
MINTELVMMMVMHDYDDDYSLGHAYGHGLSLILACVINNK